MHIGFRTSGGRGEYEIVGGAAGQPASSLEGWSFHMRWPDGQTRDTQLWLDPGGSGKPRLRSLADRPYQIGRMVAAMLLLPKPVRDRSSLASDLPVLQQGKYLVNQIGFGPDTSFAPLPESVEFEPNYVEASNRIDHEPIGVQARWVRLEALYGAADLLDGTLAQLLHEHRAVMESGVSITESLDQLVTRLIRRLAVVDPTYVEGHDPLPSLGRLAGLLPDGEGPTLPPPDEIGEDEIDIRAQAAQDYRLAKARGPSARRFSAAVREAYHHRCAFCGVTLGGIPGIRSGIDAAHILAWSSYDLDVVGNGLALCKTHHWAFDAALMVPVLERGTYLVRFTALAQKLDPEARHNLGPEVFTIPDDWLPTDPADRPIGKYLQRLYDDLEISF